MGLFLRSALLLISIWYLPVLSSYAQIAKVDSLFQVMKMEEDVNEKAKIYLQLSKLTMAKDINKSINFAKEASELSEKDEVLGDIWDQLGRLYFGKNNLDSALIGFKRAKNHKKNVESFIEAARINNRIGAVLLKQKRHEQALATFLESATFFENEDDRIYLGICYNNMAGVFAGMGNYLKAVEYSEQALGIFQENNLKQYEIITLPSLAGQYLKLKDTVKSIAYNLKAEKLGLELKNNYALGITYNNLGQLYFEKGEPQKALLYYEKSLAAKQNLGKSANLVPTYSNLGQTYITLNQPKNAITFLKKALSLAKGEELLPIYSNLTKAYIAAGEKDEATSFFERTRTYRDSVYSIEKQKAIDDLLARYETGKKEKKIIELEAQKRNNQFLVTGLAGLLAGTLAIFFLILKNNRKKQVIARQNEELDKQRLEQLLKEQEIIGIDAMLKGQEKERKKIAEELHDSLGSSLSTLRLYMDGLDPNKEAGEFQSMHTKATNMLDETYDNIRKIARNKSAGVLINKGLIPAVKATANKISAAKKIQVEVIDVGLNERLKNSVEISIFRSIQELLSNAVKYSNASEVLVQITQYDNALNIIVEDNGHGFEPEKTRFGLGLTNIQTRLEKLNGEMTIDSSEGNGATVILNIPVI